MTRQGRQDVNGPGGLAGQLLEIARGRGLEVRRDADLTEILSALELDCPIPPEAFGAVAEILAYVYRANRQPAPGRTDLASEGSRNDDARH